MSGLREWFKNKSYMAQAVFIVIVCYCVSSFVVILLCLGVVPGFTIRVRQEEGLLFTAISFGVAVFLSAYNLVQLIRRRKRKCDKLSAAEKPCNGQPRGDNAAQERR